MSQENHISTSEVTSPFMNCVSECRSRMKKLRKKIYKNLKSKQGHDANQNSKAQSFNVNRLLRDQKIPDFLKIETASLSRETGLKDISNLNLIRKVDHHQLKAYADQQERDVEFIINQMRNNQPLPLLQEFLSEEHETLEKGRSRSWLQSTEMEYDDESLMDPHSKISLRPFQLFDKEGTDLNEENEEELQSRRSTPFNHLREANGFLSLDSEELFEKQLFEF